MFKKYTIAGENNPIWQLAEPVILKTWADGMCKASYPQLYLIHLMALLVSTGIFLGGFVLRLLVVSSILFLGYTIFEQSLNLAFSAIFPSIGIDAATNGNAGEANLLLYQLLGYVILIKSVIFVFGENFTDWIKDTVLYFLLMITGMIPLKWIARGLLNENYFAQLIAKSSFMGAHIAQTISAAPLEVRNKYDTIYDLYWKSNIEENRRKLEELCAHRCVL
jgi:hypothetical protein